MLPILTAPLLSACVGSFVDQGDLALTEQVWFKVLLALGAGICVYSGISLRTRRIRNQNLELERRIDVRTDALQLEIVERKRAEQELLSVRDKLEDSVAERTRELASALDELKLDIARRESLERRLLESEKFEAIGRLAGGIAHDFNNILTAVLGEAELAKYATQDGSAEKIEGSLENIIASVDRAKRLTRQLLAYSRQQVLKPELIDPRKTILGLADMLKRITPTEVNLEINLESDCGTILIDPGQLEQVIVNLVVNAGEALKSGGDIRLRAECLEIDEARAKRSGLEIGGYTSITVQDSGEGMEPEMLPHIFEPFFSTKAPARGLGLASVHGIVHQSNGTIEVHTEQGIGTTFSVLLPLAETKATPGTDPILEREATPAADGCGNILLCDDEPDVCNVVRLALEKCGYGVLVAATPTRAIELAREMDSAPALLISDMVMPEMNGVELARLIKNIHAELRTLFISGYSKDILSHLEQGDIHENLLQKPFSVSELLNRVSETLR